MPHSMWDHSFSNRDQTMPPALEALSLNHWTASEVPHSSILAGLFFTARNRSSLNKAQIREID